MTENASPGTNPETVPPAKTPGQILTDEGGRPLTDEGGRPIVEGNPDAGDLAVIPPAQEPTEVPPAPPATPEPTAPAEPTPATVDPQDAPGAPE